MTQLESPDAVDISEYELRILDDADRPLFDDAVKAGRAGALRASYVMLWLACAESLKRRFREAAVRDGEAGRIVGAIRDKEEQKKSIDKFLLEKAKEYGFISDPDLLKLNHIYEMRCIYGHPYEQIPSKEQVTHAAAIITETILAHPVRLRHGFGRSLLNKMLREKTYIDDHQNAVVEFTKEILPRVDSRIYGWLLDQYFKDLESLVDDPTMAIFSRRGLQFCRTMVEEVGVDVFSEEDWHERTSRFPNIMVRLIRSPIIFQGIGSRAQDSTLGYILDKATDTPKVLTFIGGAYHGGVLNERQAQRVSEAIDGLDIESMRAANLSTAVCYPKIIEALKSHNWYRQNPAIEIIQSNGPDKVGELEEEQQVELGRNVLQAAEGRSDSAVALLKVLEEDSRGWPLPFMYGIAAEVFCNEVGKIRFKNWCLAEVLKSIRTLSEADREMIAGKIAVSIANSEPKDLVGSSEILRFAKNLSNFEWAAPIKTALEEKGASVAEVEVE